jgi:hypothetical protein
VLDLLEMNDSDVIPMPEFPKPFEITKWACISSCFFLVPCIYAIQNSVYLYATVCLYNTLLSVNHWINAEDGIRRVLDRIAAYGCFIVYFVSGCLYCKGIYFYGYGIPILCTVLGFFFTSNKLSVEWHPHWIYSHMMFHLSAAVSEVLVIWAYLEHTKNIETIC